MYNVIIIGAGAAGMAAGVTAAKQNLKVLVIARENVKPQDKADNGFFKAEKLFAEFNALCKSQSIEFINQTEVISLEKNVVSFAAQIKNGALYYGKSVIIATGYNVQAKAANTDFEKNARKDFEGRVIVDVNQASSVSGLYAAGDAAVGRKNNLLLVAAEGARAVFSSLNM